MDHTKVISQQIRMLQDLRRLSRKPRFWDALKLFTHEGPTNGIPSHVNGNAPEKRSAVLDTGITKAVVATLSKMHGRLTYPDVVRGLKQDEYTIQAGSERDAVGRVLRNLAKKGRLIREVGRQAGGGPTVYERIE
jgi:hypothetical protein